MPSPWPTIRAVASKVDRVTQGGAVVVPAAAAPVNDFNNNKGIRQDTFSTGDGVFRSPNLSQEEVKSRAAVIEPGPAVDVVKEQHMSVFTFLKIVTAVSALYMAADTWVRLHYDGNGYSICPRMVLCTSTLTEMILLTGSRLSAGVLYSGLTISMFSKCYATRSLMHNSWFGTVVDFGPSHDIHTYFGQLTLVAAFVHTILHCARFTYGGQAYIIYETDTGRSGVIGCILLLPIVLPMKLECLRTKMSFQFRKRLHMLLLPLMVALCFHSVTFRYVGFIIILWYTLDRVYFTTKQTFLVDNPLFEAVGRGTMVTIDLPTGYTFKAGSYIYVNSPMINRNEWHPFSIIQHPGAVPRATFYAEAVGDWTQELFRLGLDQPRLPLWITAAQPSLMEKSIYYDNVVLVCTGAGITPAVSIIERFSKRKNIHLLWMTRDGGMVALFEQEVRKVNSTVHLTGRPAADTKNALRRLLQPSVADSPAAMRKMGFRSIVANGALASARPTTTPIARHFRGGAGVMNPIAHDDGGDLEMFPATELVLPERFSVFNKPRSTASPSLQRQTNSPVDAVDPIKLELGRPDIAAYLKETFITGTDRSRAHPERDLETASVRGEASFWGGSDRTGGLLRQQASSRLDKDQEISKTNLLKADVNVIEACQQQQKKRGMRKSVASSPSAMTSRPCHLLPWLVLYCGANPKVEEAVAKTCDELGVNWQKEYFGAW